MKQMRYCGTKDMERKLRIYEDVVYIEEQYDEGAGSTC